MTVSVPFNANPKSKWPTLCQILGNLCLSPAGSIPQDVKGAMLDLLTALGFLISGIMTLLVGCCSSIVLDILSLILNQVSAFVGFMGVALYSWDLVSASFYSATLIQEQMKGADAFLYFEDSNMMFRRTLDVMMIALAVLQLCLNVYFIVILVRVFVEKNSAEEPQLHKLLQEDTTADPA
ncbi:uncharacterized protein [Paramisgurnus dabryanus]|uniref:uncharacterized protein isoform X2 n=1 Tax=Paramisgurnus dabryanus TaxID=90735 RepID=UPI0031F3B4D8